MSVYNELFLFDGLEQKDKDEIALHFPEPVEFKKGDLIYSTGSYKKAIAIVISGQACADADNQNHVFMRRFAPGSCFGAAAVFGETDSYVSTVYAETDSKIIFINEDILTNVFAKYPITAINYITFLSGKIRFLNSRLSIITCSNAENTVLKYLTATQKDGCTVIPKMTQLSKALGLGRASLYRSLDALEASGRIKRENNRIIVIDSPKKEIK